MRVHRPRSEAVRCRNGADRGHHRAAPGDPGSLAGTPVFPGTSDPDPHVPFERVEKTGRVFSRMGAGVDLRRYPGMPHTINEDEPGACRTLLDRLTGGGGEVGT